MDEREKSSERDWLLTNLLCFVLSTTFNFQNPQSMMTFEGQQFQGPEAIINKFKGVGQVKHQVKSMDVQPSNNPSAIVVFVTGSIQIGGENPLHFCEFFHLVSTGPGQYYVHNDVFRLNYGL